MNDVRNFSESMGWKFSRMDDFDGATKLLSFIAILLPSWSQKDFLVINAIKNKISSYEVDVYVLDIDDFKSQDELRRLFSGIIEIYQTPVFMHFENGNLKRMAQGPDEVKNMDL